MLKLARRKRSSKSYSHALNHPARIGDGRTALFRTNSEEWSASYGGRSAWQTANPLGAALDHLIFGDLDSEGRTNASRCCYPLDPTKRTATLLMIVCATARASVAQSLDSPILRPRLRRTPGPGLLSRRRSSS